MLSFQAVFHVCWNLQIVFIPLKLKSPLRNINANVTEYMISEQALGTYWAHAWLYNVTSLLKVRAPFSCIFWTFLFYFILSVFLSSFSVFLFPFPPFFPSFSFFRYFFIPSSSYLPIFTRTCFIHFLYFSISFSLSFHLFFSSVFISLFPPSFPSLSCILSLYTASFVYHFLSSCITSVESQKGAIDIQRFSVENKKGAIAVQCLWW